MSTSHFHPTDQQNVGQVNWQLVIAGRFECVSKWVIPVIDWQPARSVFCLSPIWDGIHSSPSCQCVTAFHIILHLTFWWYHPISQKAAGSIIISVLHWGPWVRHLTMTGFLTVRRNHLKVKEVLVYLWCHCGRARWADARHGWSVWIAAVFAHGVGRCPRSQRKGWRDCAPPPWRGLSPSLSPHLGEEQQKIDRQRKR